MRRMPWLARQLLMGSLQLHVVLVIKCRWFIMNKSFASHINLMNPICNCEWHAFTSRCIWKLSSGDDGLSGILIKNVMSYVRNKLQFREPLIPVTNIILITQYVHTRPGTVEYRPGEHYVDSIFASLCITTSWVEFLLVQTVINCTWMMCIVLDCGDGKNGNTALIEENASTRFPFPSPCIIENHSILVWLFEWLKIDPVYEISGNINTSW